MSSTAVSREVVVGAGPVGTALAERLRDEGREVVVVTRSGQRPDRKDVQRVALDAADPEALSAVAAGARALYNCANPSDYTQWESVWPPLAESLLTAAERSGATLVTAAALYPYGPVDGPMTEVTPDRATDHKGRLRAGMWAEAKARHEAGRIRAVEVRASDYLGVGVGQNGHISRQLPTATRGRAAWVVGDPDLPHSWTDVADMACALAAVAGRPDTWGQVWHAPTNEPRSQRQALTDVLAARGRGPVAMHTLPKPLLTAVGRFVPMIREVNETAYMFRRPYVLSSARTETVLGLAPSAWAEVCRRTADGNP